MIIEKISSWHTPATSYPLVERGSFRIHRQNYKGVYHNWGVNGVDYINVAKPIPVTSLQERREGKWHDWMVDDPPHWWSMQRYANAAAGRVLVGGLGLGLFLHALAPRVQSGDVTSIIVIERAPAVKRLIAPLVPPLPLEYVMADFYDVFRMLEYDFALVDLWVSGSALEKQRIYTTEVLPLYANMRVRQPKATLVFHGFVTVSDVRLWPEGFNPDMRERRRQDDQESRTEAGSANGE